MPDPQLKLQTKSHRMGNSAIAIPAIRYINKEDLMLEISMDKFKEYDALFDYVDKFDNVDNQSDGKIDLASFGDPEFINQYTSKVFFIGEIFTSDRRIKFVSEKLNTSVEKIQNFFNLLFNFQTKRDSYLKNSIYDNDRKAVKDNCDFYAVTNNKVTKEDGTCIISTTYSDGSKTNKVYNKAEELLESMEYDKNGQLIEKVKYKYHYFKTEEEALNFYNNLQADEIDIYENKGKWMVVGGYYIED